MKTLKPHLGFIGWRGMVGSVLLERMLEEKDFDHFTLSFFSSSLGNPSTPKKAPKVPHHHHHTIQDSNDLDILMKLDIILTTQGGAYSEKILPELRKRGWNGFWIDAASTFRMEDNARIVLDPLNKTSLIRDVKNGIKTFSGANCSTATLLIGLAGLFQAELVEWVSFMSYQSISGAGAQALDELIAQNTYLSNHLLNHTDNSSSSSSPSPLTALKKEAILSEALGHQDFPKSHIGYPLSSNLLPWIDSDVGGGSSREERKTMEETNKILGTQSPIPIDGTCVRVGVYRSHSFGCTVKLKETLSAEKIEMLIAEAHPWAKVVPNNPSDSLAMLTPANVARDLNVYVGRIRQTRIDPQIINAFIIADQLLWGAAEPLRRMLRLLLTLQQENSALLTQPA